MGQEFDDIRKRVLGELEEARAEQAKIQSFLDGLIVNAQLGLPLSDCERSVIRAGAERQEAFRHFEEVVRRFLLFTDG